MDSITISRLNEGVDKTEQLAWLVRYEALRRIGPSHLSDAPVDDQLRQRLLMWVRNQRKQYRNYIEGKKTTLTTRRVDMLNEINFEWNHKEIYEEDNWNEMKSALEDFKTRHGHCFIPLAYHKNRKLGEWVHFQRQIYQAKQRGDTSNLPDLICKYNQKDLIHLGLDLTMDNLSYGQIAFDLLWEEKIEELRKFKQEHGHCNICSHYTSEYYDLALWLQEQKTLAKLSMKGISSQLDKRRKKELETLGFI